MQDEDARAREELRKLTAEGDKLQAEVGRIRLLNSLDTLKLLLMTFGAGVAALTAANAVGWLQGAGSMLERHEVLASGMRVDRPWWLGTKLTAAVVATLVAAYFTASILQRSAASATPAARPELPGPHEPCPAPLAPSHRRGHVTLRVRDDGIAVRDDAVGADAIGGGQAVVQLLLGVEDASEVVAVNGIEMHGEAARLLPVLFPPQHPQMENQAL